MQATFPIEAQKLSTDAIVGEMFGEVVDLAELAARWRARKERSKFGSIERSTAEALQTTCDIAIRHWFAALASFRGDLDNLPPHVEDVRRRAGVR